MSGRRPRALTGWASSKIQSVTGVHVAASIIAIAGGIASGLVGGALAVIFAGRIERRKAMGKYAHKQRAELDALIGRYQGRLLEAALDWERRMRQLWDPGN